MESSHSSRLVLWEAMPGGGRYSWDLLRAPCPPLTPVLNMHQEHFLRHLSMCAWPPAAAAASNPSSHLA